VFFIALAVRTVYAVVVDPHAPLLSDATTYHLQAVDLADGKGLVRPFELAQEGRRIPSAEFPPLFPAVLAVVVLLGGRSFMAHKLVMGVVGAGTVLLVGLLVRRVAGPGAGIVAAVVAALYPMLFQSDAIPMPETLYAFLVTAAVLLALRAREDAGLKWWAGLGALVGLAGLTRAEGLLLVPLLVLPLAARLRAGRSERVRVAAVALGATALVLVPWTVRNALTFHELLPTSRNIGSAIGGANCPTAWHGPKEGLWDFACVHRQEDRRLSEGAQDRRYRDAGLRYARAHLGRLPRELGVRLLRTWGLHPRFRQQAFYGAFEGRSPRWEILGTRIYWGLLPCAVGGAVVLARRRNLALWPLLSVVVLVSLSTMITYGNQRFREAAEPVVIVLAAVGIAALVSRTIVPSHEH